MYWIAIYSPPSQNKERPRLVTDILHIYSFTQPLQASTQVTALNLWLCKDTILRDATHVWGKNRKTGNKYSCNQLPFPSYPNLFRPTSPQLSLIATNGALG